ncbi:hypothetical protein D3C75_989600 [compost metagenome]
MDRFHGAARIDVATQDSDAVVRLPADGRGIAPLQPLGLAVVDVHPVQPHDAAHLPGDHQDMVRIVRQDIDDASEVERVAHSLALALEQDHRIPCFVVQRKDAARRHRQAGPHQVGT